MPGSLVYSVTTYMCSVRKSSCGLLLSRLQQYDYKIRYKPRNGVLTANTLSRAYIEDCERWSAEVKVERFHAYHFLPFSDHELNEIQREKETNCPSALQSLNNLGRLPCCKNKTKELEKPTVAIPSKAHSLSL